MASNTPTQIRPLFALAGAGDLVVERLRKAPAELQKEFAKLPQQVQAQVGELQKLPTEVHSRANAFGVIATAVYGELVNRGEKVVQTLRGQNGNATSTAKAATKAS